MIAWEARRGDFWEKFLSHNLNLTQVCWFEQLIREGRKSCLACGAHRHVSNGSVSFHYQQTCVRSISLPVWPISSPVLGNSPRWEARYPMVFCSRRMRRGYEPIWDSGEDMRLRNQRWLIHSSSLNWRSYAPEVAKLWSFWHISLSLH